MSKKSLIMSLVFGALATLSLGVYTLVSAIIALTTPHHTTEVLAYTDNTLRNGEMVELVITDFANYSEEKRTLNIQYEGDELLEYHIEENNYTLKKDAEGKTIAFGDDAKAGDKVSFVVVATTDKYGSTITYNVNVYHQGTGASADDPYVIANAEGLKSVAENVNSSADAALREGFVEVVENIDMAGEKYVPIGKDYSFKGSFEGNGKAIKNLSINVNADNYADYVMYGSSSHEYGMHLGLFGLTVGANISGVALENASVNVEDNVLPIFNQDITVGDHPAQRLLEMRVGLLVANAVNTTVDGTYVTDVQKVDENGEPVVDGDNPVYETAIATVEGRVTGLQYSKGYASADEETFLSRQSSTGGLVGFAESGSFKNYKVVATLENSKAQNFDLVGGAFGITLGTASDKVEVENFEVNLTAKTQFHAQKYVGGLAAWTYQTNVKNSKMSAVVVDSENATIQDLNKIIGADGYTGDDDYFSFVSGIAARATLSEYSAVESNSNIAVWTKVSGGFVLANQVDLLNVKTSGTLTGYTVSGLARTVYNSEISFVNETEETMNASSMTLYGHDSAALVDYAVNTNIVATGNVSVASNADISAFGYRVTNTKKNNIIHSSGLVGYFYTTEEDNTKTYRISGFDVKASIKNGVDMAGVATYLGNQSNTYAKVEISDVTVDATFESYSQGNYTSAHKVGGAVATIYGNATLDGVDAVVSFNKGRTSGSYGAAMFGGLVARIGGRANIVNCSTDGVANISNSGYYVELRKEDTEDSYSFKQMLIGGLVGAIAAFGDDTLVIEPGKHPIYTIADESRHIEVGDTRDEILPIAASLIDLTGNVAGMRLNITYTEDYSKVADSSNAMFIGGYKVRSAGLLVGLFMNDGSHSLADNTAYSKDADGILMLVADDATFRTETETRGTISTKGNGRFSNGESRYENPKIVGCTYDLINLGDYSDTWVMPEGATKTA